MVGGCVTSAIVPLLGDVRLAADGRAHEASVSAAPGTGSGGAPTRVNWSADAGIAQLAERCSCKAQVTGSIPVPGSLAG